ncbi:protopine O-dealkylase [Cannabis sativa]|uniref:protopine O-dealkylase n=1 Tax=Cannabis sativa TaxID=3483 RepID=UPI0029CA3356|nr:protopine O-dealkylase [Cannabis sativa]
MEFKSSRLVVPSVQELLAKDPNMVTIPSRYIQNPQNNINNSVSLDHQIPVINFQNLFLHDDDDHHQSELSNLHSACKDWGFFQLINHGISDCLIENVKKGVEDLFKLSVEEKKKLCQLPGDIEGFGQTQVFSEEQKLDWTDYILIFTLPLALRKPHLFPNLPITLKQSLEIYSLQLAKLAKDLICQMEKILGIKNDEISNLFEDGLQLFSMNCYPPCPEPEKVIGLSHHSDGGCLTFLLQVNEVQGLQVKKDGMWLPINPLPNAFVVNIGDVLEILTNGIYRSIEHRVTINSTQERLSIATFHNLSIDSVIAPANTLITPKNPALYKTLSNKEYFKDFFSSELQGKSYLDSMKL